MPNTQHRTTVYLLTLVVLGGCRPDPPAVILEALLQRPEAAARDRLAERIALEPLAGKTEFLGHRVAALGLTGDYWTVGRRPAAVVFSNDEDSPLRPTLVLAGNTDLDGPAMTATVEDGQQTRRYDFSTGAVQRISLQAVPPHSRRLYVVRSSRSWRPGNKDPRPLGVRVGLSLTEILAALQLDPTARRTTRLLRLMAHEPFHGKGRLLGDRVVTVGLNQDRWTDDGRTAGVVVENRGRSPWSPELALTCDAAVGELPVAVTVITARAHAQRYFFHRQGGRRVILPRVQPGEQRLTTITADRVRILSTSERQRRGVRLSLATSGLLRQLIKGKAASDRHYRAALAERIWARDLPRTRALKGAPAVAVELSPDGWTLDGNPGAVVITNRAHTSAGWTLVLGCDALPRSLPLTAVVNDGKNRREVRFSLSGEVRVPLAPVLPFTRRLVAVSSDHWWTPGTASDSRKLGVRLRLEKN